MTVVEPATAMDALLRTVSVLPAELIREVADFAEFLGRKRLIPAVPVEYEDWTEEDLRQLTIASLKRFEEEHGEENWGVDYEAMLRDKQCSPQEM